MKLPIIFLIFAAVLACSVSAQNLTTNLISNVTIQTSNLSCSDLNCTENCPECNCTSNCPELNCSDPWENVSFNLMISPGERIENYQTYLSQKIGLSYDVTCIACEQESSEICSIDHKIDPGEEYARHTSSCDIDIECEPCDEQQIIEKSCPDGNRTVEIPLIMETRNNDNELMIHVGDADIVHTVGKGMDYQSHIEIQCPACEEVPEFQTNWTYEMCRQYASELCFSEEAANLMVKELSGSVKLIATEHRECSDDLAIARSEKDTCNNQKQGHEITIQNLENENTDLKNQLDEAEKKYQNVTGELNALKKEDKCSSQKVALGVVSPIAILLLISTVGLLVVTIKHRTQGGIE